MTLRTTHGTAALSLVLASSLLITASTQASWTMLDNFEAGTGNWSKTEGLSWDDMGNTSIYSTVADPARAGNQVLSYTEGNAKGIYHTLGANAIPVGGTATLYFEWYLPNGGNYDVGVGFSDEAIPTPSRTPFHDYPDLAFRAQASDGNPFVHFKVQTQPDPSNSGIWEVTTTPFTQGEWWSYWMVVENLGGAGNAVSYYTALLGDSPTFHWSNAYQPTEFTPLESVLMIGGGNGLNTDVTFYDNFAIAPGVELTAPVPEPSAYALLTGALATLALLRRRHQTRSA